jgi:hypothetical protein
MIKTEIPRSAKDLILKEMNYRKTKSKMFCAGTGNESKNKYTSRNRK